MMRRLFHLGLVTALASCSLWAAPTSVYDPPITLDLKGAALTDALTQLSAVGGTKVAMPADAKPATTTVTVVAAGHPLSQVLAALALQVGGTLSYQVASQSWLLTPSTAPAPANAPLVDARPVAQADKWALVLNSYRARSSLTTGFGPNDPNTNSGLDFELAVAPTSPAALLAVMGIDGTVQTAINGQPAQMRRRGFGRGGDQTPQPITPRNGVFDLNFDLPATPLASFAVSGQLIVLTDCVERSFVFDDLAAPNQTQTDAGVDMTLVGVQTAGNVKVANLTLKRTLGAQMAARLGEVLRDANGPLRIETGFGGFGGFGGRGGAPGAPGGPGAPGAPGGPGGPGARPAAPAAPAAPGGQARGVEGGFMFALAPAQAGGVQFAQAPPVAQPGQPGQPGQPRQGGPGGQGGQGGPGGRGGNPGFGGFGGFGGDGMAFIGDRPLRLDMAAVARWLLPAVAVETAPGKRVGIDPKACERTVRFAGNTLTVTMRVPLTGDAAEAKSLLVGVVDPGDKTANVPFALANVPLGAK